MARRGPATPEGRALASRNATGHGLYSDAIPVAGESPEAWRSFCDGVVASLAPQDSLEAALAVRIAALLWCLRRVPAAESALLRRGAGRHAGEAPGRPIDAPPLLLPDAASLAIVIRREAHLDRQLRHALHQLEALQDRRRDLRNLFALVAVDGLRNRKNDKTNSPAQR